MNPIAQSTSVKRIVGIVFSCAIIFVVGSCATYREGKSSVDVIYIPLPISTYSPVTMDNIKDYDACRFSLPAKMGKETNNWRLNSSHVFDANNVRVAISSDQGQIFIDQDRVLHRHDASGAAAESSELDALIALLEALRKSGDCHQFDWINKRMP